MTEDPLYVDEIDILRAPGFESGGFPVEGLCEGINVVHGPNASGKTTIARSIQWLLWPDDASDRATVTGGLAIDGERWRVDVDRGRAEYQRNGQETNGPSLPPLDQKDRYVLSLHELLQDETRDETFAEAIERESAGGYDLSAAVSDLGFDDSPTSPQKGEVGDAESAVEDWRDAEREIEELRDDQRRLPSLRRDIEEVRDAKQRVELLDQAIDYARARDDLEETAEAFEDFPDVLHRIVGDEAEIVEDLDGRIEEWDEKTAEAEASLEGAEEQLEEADLPEEGVPDGFIGQVKQRRDDLDSLEGRKRDYEANLANCERQRAKALEEVPIDVEGEDLAALDPGAWEEISKFAQEAESVRAERELRDAVERWLTEEEELERDRSTLERGSKALEQWLAHPPVEPSDDDRPALAIAAVSAVLLGISGAVLGFLTNPAGYLLIPLAGVLLWYAYRSRTSTADGDNAREAHEDTFQGLGLESPGSWTEDAVRGRLMDLYDAIAEHRIADEREQQREARLSDIDELEDRESGLEDRRKALRDRVGAAPGTADIELVVTTKAILRWQEAHGRVLGLQEKITTVEGQIDSTRSDLQDELAPYGYDTVGDSAEATQHTRDLESRARKHDEASKAMSNAEETIDEAESKVEELRRERDEVFSDIDLDPDEFDRLRSLCDRAEAYDEAKQARDNAELLASKEKAELEAMPGYEPELKGQQVSELAQQKREAEETASSYDDVQKATTEIEKEIDDAKEDDRVEDALAEKERALDALAHQLDRDYDSMVGNVLAEIVREGTTDANRPDVFDHARDVLARISKGRYRLDLADGEDTFRAYDTIKERGFALDELSSATRLQVLLAVRIAFVERQEQGTRLPILLDETLANTDDGKAEVIIESMMELARDGRQLFYFTAQGDEVAKWLTAIEEADDVDHAVVDLADVQNLDRHVEVPDLDAIADRPSSPPDPDGHDHEAYGEVLEVPPFDPRRGAGAAHLWYVAEDVDLLHRLLDLGVERWGQLENLLSNSSGAVLTDDRDRLETVARNGKALEEFVWSWRKGRGERVDRGALEASGAVSGTFIAEVTELANGLDGDGERIVRALRDGQVDRFRTGKADELEAFLEDEGYVESIDPLEPEQVRVRVIDCLVENDLPRERAKERGQRLLDRLATSSVS